MQYLSNKLFSEFSLKLCHLKIVVLSSGFLYVVVFYLKILSKLSISRNNRISKISCICHELAAIAATACTKCHLRCVSLLLFRFLFHARPLQLLHSMLYTMGTTWHTALLLHIACLGRFCALQFSSILWFVLRIARACRLMQSRSCVLQDDCGCIANTGRGLENAGRKS